MGILILDDREDTIEDLVDTLRETETPVHYASTIEDAIEYLKENPCEAIISDLDMPVDGLQFLSLVRGEIAHDVRIRVLAKRLFPEGGYRNFVDKYEDCPLILYTGNRQVDREHPALKGVAIYQKGKNNAEQHILELLKEEGVIEDDFFR